MPAAIGGDGAVRFANTLQHVREFQRPKTEKRDEVMIMIRALLMLLKKTFADVIKECLKDTSPQLHESLRPYITGISKEALDYPFVNILMLIGKPMTAADKADRKVVENIAMLMYVCRKLLRSKQFIVSPLCARIDQANTDRICVDGADVIDDKLREWFGEPFTGDYSYIPLINNALSKIWNRPQGVLEPIMMPQQGGARTLTGPRGGKYVMRNGKKKYVK
jgi:hypothetical protein